jgi:membrane protease subunit HflC
VRRGLFGGAGLVILAAIAIVAYLGLFIVYQTEMALVLRFGDPVRVVNAPPSPDAETSDVGSSAPGLYTKLPLIDNVIFFDKRILDLDSQPLEIIAADQKRLVVDAFARYKIVDPLLFYQSVGTIEGAESRLSAFLNSAVRRVLGEATFIQLVRDERADLMARITAQVDREVQGIGVQLVDVKIRRADLPAENSAAIYQRMQTERQREATDIRARGEEAARRIRAGADRTTTVIVAEANGESERLRGDGDAEVNRIFAESFGKDPDFFAFYRAMLAYQQGLRPTDTRLVITPDSDFFRYFNDPQGSVPNAEPSAEEPAAAPSAASPPVASTAEPGDAPALD